MGSEELPVAQLPPRYPAVGAGALGGGIVGGATGVGLAVLLFDDPADGAWAVLAVLFLLMGSGATGGVWLTLKAAGDAATARTTFMMTAGFLAWVVVSVPSLFWAVEVFPSTGPGKVGGLLVLVAMLSVPPALGARWIIVANEKLANREETSR